MGAVARNRRAQAGVQRPASHPGERQHDEQQARQPGFRQLPGEERGGGIQWLLLHFEQGMGAAGLGEGGRGAGDAVHGRALREQVQQQVRLGAGGHHPDDDHREPAGQALDAAGVERTGPGGRVRDEPERADLHDVPGEPESVHRPSGLGAGGVRPEQLRAGGGGVDGERVGGGGGVGERGGGDVFGGGDERADEDVFRAAGFGVALPHREHFVERGAGADCVLHERVVLQLHDAGGD